MSAATGIAADYLALVAEAARATALPRIREVWIPPPHDDPAISAEFGAVILDDGSVGLMFVLLADTLAQIGARFDPATLAGVDPVELAAGFAASDPVRKALGLAAVNAIGQHVLARSGCRLDTATDSIADIAPQPGDHVGMVGYFPPLVRRLREQAIALTVIELKPELVQREGAFEVTLDPAALGRCNKILCTSTLVLNDSVDRMLEHCRHAERVAVIGPSAGFLPDPLFARGVDTVGGNQVVDAVQFLDHCNRGEAWGASARKYGLRRDTYPGYRALLGRLAAH